MLKRWHRNVPPSSKATAWQVRKIAKFVDWSRPGRPVYCCQI